MGKGAIVKAAAAIHLALAALYGSHLQLEQHLPAAVDRVLSFYGAFSGTRSRFDFFAPTVSTQARADFLVVGADGSTRRVRLAQTSIDEANRRLGLMFTIYAVPTERENLLRAWADYVLRLHPEAVEVVSRVEVLDIPTMQQAAGGMVPTWREAGRATVRRGAGGGR